jgi:hypothetical protein
MRSPVSALLKSPPNAGTLRFGNVRDYVAAADHESFLFTERAFPFRTFRIAQSGTLAIAFDPASQMSALARSEVLSGWVSMPIVRFGNARLQILAEMASDRRQLIILDATGHVEHSRVIDVALGILDADSTTHVAIAVRDAGGGEDLIFYRWRWRVPQQHGER